MVYNVKILNGEAVSCFDVVLAFASSVSASRAHMGLQSNACNHYYCPIIAITTPYFYYHCCYYYYYYVLLLLQLY
jgi:hypothetical protein